MPYIRLTARLFITDHLVSRFRDFLIFSGVKLGRELIGSGSVRDWRVEIEPYEDYKTTYTQSIDESLYDGEGQGNVNMYG